ncbi:MAG: ABC transporter substrate-binding protein, partial [Candidatus Bipolaricaulia bacterium]
MHARRTSCSGKGVVGVLVLGLVVLLAGTLAVAAGSGVTLTIVRGTDLWTGDPQNDTQATSRSLLNNVFDPLVRIDWNDMGNPLPALAVAWEVLSPTSIRFHLRQGVLWHDGREFTAADVKFTFDRLLNKEKPTKVSPLVSSIIAGVTVEDDYTVVLQTFNAYAPIFSRLATIYIMPEETFLEM